MKLNRYTLNNGGKNYYNTVLHRSLPIAATEAELAAEYCLEGQEQECLNRALFDSPNGCNFEIIPTWECNLRCTHCSVIHQLKKKDDDVLNVDKLISFIQAYVKAYTPPLKKITLSFVGGEPLLRAKQLDDLMTRLEVPVDSWARMTTNLSVDLGEVEMSLLSKIKQITVSIDGSHEQHNAQRKVLIGDFDPYQQTISNLKILLKHFGMNVQVQAAVRDEFYNPESKRDYFQTMLRLGVHKDNISFGCIHPTLKKPEPQKSYLKSLQVVNLRTIPCCKFRFMRNMIIDSSNRIFSEFFAANPDNQLGTLDDSFEAIQKRHRETINTTMPALKDPKCLDCPVIGYCWGGCVNGAVLIGDRPSHFCNQKGLIEKIGVMAQTGTLHDYRSKRTQPDSFHAQQAHEAAGVDQEPEC
jgi:radical SAM protein with 4Fe4S-binding SPASM domain